MRGSVRRHGAGWSYIVDLGPHPATGKRQQTRRSGFKTKRDAENALGEVLASAQARTYTTPSRHALGAFLEREWLPAARSRLRPSTFTFYSTFTSKYVIPNLGAASLVSLTPATLNAFYADLLDHGARGGRALAPKTVRHVHQLIRTALGDALRWGMVTRNVAEAADPPAVRRPEMHVWNAAELGAFVSYTREDRLAAMWLLLATTGMRRSEVVGLPWSAVDVSAGRLAVTQTAVKAGTSTVVESATKSARSRRTVALDPETVTALKAHRAHQLKERMVAGPAWTDTGLAFVREDGIGLDPVWVARRFHQLVARAGLPRIRLHDVRHSWATAALGAGIPLKVVSERLGHSSLSTTADTYQHVSEGMDRQAAEKVASLILGVTNP
jgi:integrase